MASLQVQKATSSNNKEVKQLQDVVQVNMVNLTQTAMTLDRSISWSGAPANPGFPTTIPRFMPVMFNHLGDCDYGSMAAVIYKGVNLQGKSCAWVLAWDARSRQTPSKVYVMSGLKNRIDDFDFGQIRKFLNNSPPSSTDVEIAGDDDSKTGVLGTITDILPNNVTLGATFSLIP